MSLLPYILHIGSQFAAYQAQDLIANAPGPHYNFPLPIPTSRQHLHNQQTSLQQEHLHFTPKYTPRVMRLRHNQAQVRTGAV